MQCCHSSQAMCNRYVPSIASTVLRILLIPGVQCRCGRMDSAEVLLTDVFLLGFSESTKYQFSSGLQYNHVRQSLGSFEISLYFVLMLLQFRLIKFLFWVSKCCFV